MAFYPDYSRHGIAAGKFAYDFSYEVNISANSPISNLSMPEGASDKHKSSDRKLITVTGSHGARSLDFFYRTMDMMIPQLVYAKDPKSDAVALSVSLVPTFDEVQPQDFYEAV